VLAISEPHLTSLAGFADEDPAEEDQPA
jgi:hypothetical protein